MSLRTLYGSLSVIEGLGTEVQLRVPTLDINYGDSFIGWQIKNTAQEKTGRV